MALIFVLVGCAWLLYYYLPGNDFTYFWGFFAMAVILVVLGVLAGLIAAQSGQTRRAAGAEDGDRGGPQDPRGRERASCRDWASVAACVGRHPATRFCAWR